MHPSGWKRVSRASLIGGCMFCAYLTAAGSVPIFFTRDDEAVRLLDALAADGLLPIDAATTRHHDRQWLLDRLRNIPNAYARVSPFKQQRLHDLSSFLDFDDATVRIDTTDPLSTSALHVYGNMGARQRFADADTTTRWTGSASFFGTTGGFGFFGESGVGVFTNKEAFEPEPTDYVYRGQALGFLPKQLWLTPKGYVSVGNRHVSAQLGKMDIAWGPGRSASMLISDNTDAKSGARLSALLGPLRFESLTATLPHAGHETYVSAHRLTVRLHPNVAISAYEAVVYKGRLELTYVNPITVYLLTIPGVESSLKRGSDNLIMGGELLWRVARGTLVFVDVTLDDIQPQEGTGLLADWDTKFAAQAGLHAYDPFGWTDASLRAEYAFANQYAYTHERDGLNYTLAGRPMGYWLGPDADSLWLEAARWLSARTWVGTAFRLTRKGEQSIDVPHTASDAPTWEFLSGSEEITREVDVAVKWGRIARSQLSARLFLKSVSNVDHVQGEADTRWGLELKARLHL